MTSLYEIATLSRKAQDDLCNLDLDEQAIADTLEGIAGDLKAKATDIAMVMKNIEAISNAIGEAIKQMSARKKILDARAERIEEYIKLSMKAGNIKRIPCPYFVLARKDNPPKVKITNEKLIPVGFMRIPDPPKPEPDKNAIKEALQAGQIVPGAELETTERLEIK